MARLPSRAAEPGTKPAPDDEPGSDLDATAKRPKKKADQASAGPITAPTDSASGIRVLIGSTPGGSQVFWEPHRPDAALNNFGILVTGDPGSGKTQVLKVLIAAAADLRLPVTIFDFKNDYAEPAFAKKHGLQVYDIDRQGLPFNPLSLIPDERGEAQPIRQVHELVGILTRIFNLGNQQEARLRKGIVAAYEAVGIRVDARQLVSSVKAVPSFADVKQELEADEKNELLLNRLYPLLDLNLFPDTDKATTTFEKLIRDRIVLDLHALPSDAIKAAISEFIIVRLHGYILKGEQPRELRRLLVFDEAWRVKDSVRLQELAREGRAFGVGILVGTQFPGDIPENLAGNLATQLLLSNQDPDHRKTVVRTLCGATSGPEATRLSNQVALLQKHQGFFRNQQYAPYAMVETLPYYRRGDV
ncbi:MAG: ATP-binding protein [Polyangiaceae bacterium]